MPAGSQISRAELRQLLMSVLPTDSDQDAFVLDFFREIYRQFAAGMDRPRKLNLLIESHETDEILKALEQHAPQRLRKYLSKTPLQLTTASPVAPYAASPAASPLSVKSSQVPPEAWLPVAPPVASPLPVKPSRVPHVVCLHSDEERADYHELRKHLVSMLRAEELTLWGSTDTSPGDDLEAEHSQHIAAAAVVLLLVSQTLLADDALDRATTLALARRSQGGCVVIPVIVRSAGWKNSPFGTLQPLPRDGQPIRQHTDRDAAWLEVVAGLRKVLKPRTS